MTSLPRPSTYLQYPGSDSMSTSPSDVRDSNPKFERDLDGYASETMIEESKWTSVMIRNIPCRYTQQELIDEIEMLGFVIDFLYLPPARRATGNLGYAFVNFVDPDQ